MGKIDFVIAWVDSSDSKWLTEKQKFEEKTDIYVGKDDANADCRYRNDGLLKYWFRSIERFVPWVNKIHFVTCGQKPDWLNENNTRINLVNHEDYIPSKYLPTFCSRTIELNFHRISGLSEKFVYFNDDMFLLQPVKEDFFFKSGNPVLDTNLRYTNKVGYNNWSRVLFNDYCVVNKSFDISNSIWNNRKKWFSVKDLGWKRALINFICYLANKTLPVSIYGHVASPHLKSTLQELWEKCPDIMEQTSMHKFRTDNQVNQWLLCAWNQAKGLFYPAREVRLGRCYSISPNNVEEICNAIINQSFPQICINDSKNNTTYDYCMEKIAKAFESLFPDKSEFEKDF